MRSSVNMREVAERAGVSVATVSRVLRENAPVAAATRQRVLAAVAELRYKPNLLARAFAERRHSKLGIVFPSLSGPYYAGVIEGFEKAAVTADHSVAILATHQRADRAELVWDLAGRVDGLVVMGRTVADDLVAALALDGIPVVLLARPATADAPAVRAENVAAAIALTTHLIDVHRHRAIAFLGDPALSPDAAERWHGVGEAHRQAGLLAPAAPIPCTYQQEDGYVAAYRALQGEEPPSALICANDEVAIGACGAARDLGLRVPEELAVTGWDDIPLAPFVSPPLTTVSQPMAELGVAAARLLLTRIRGEPPAGEGVVLPTHLVVRRSCGCDAADNLTRRRFAALVGAGVAET